MPKIAAGSMEFHISRRARDRYQFDHSIFSLSGNVLFANFHAARQFVQKMNEKRDLVSFPEQAVRAGQINAMGLVDEILHFVIGLYRQQVNPLAMEQALDWVIEHVGQEATEKALRQFSEQFPPSSVYRREISLEEYLNGETRLANGVQVPNRQIALEEMLLLWLANVNPAFSPYLELFRDEDLERESAYPQIIDSLHSFFDIQPPFGPDNQNLVDMLRSPAIAVPHSLSGQLEYIRSHWGSLLGKYLYRLLSSLDFIKEEEKAIFLGPGPASIYEFAGLELEPERFSPDKDWMPKLVLIAKNSYVWLDQLSKKYGRSITKLSDIPGEELDRLASWGFTGLWLIGLWERSEASKRIKQLRGNPDAVASAYSLFDYQIAQDLGGEEAYRDLRERAWNRGIRLSSDMVPNHMGIDSRWLIEHPDWFISLDTSPFPSYTFNGPNLSWDERVGIFLEDHYYNNTDAAVVFKRVDFWTGSEKYVYHGNDGTSMPWNDTAQLNYLIPEVREAVIQTILQVARKFPIIRFDAAMTLAKKHYQRLWFPEPGSGGDIPSRAEHGMTKEQFDALFPHEFWREVVDRVAQEVPDTLLLAEAFWLMEGYFVRTLGMHRVYNSAFMNMLRDEKNQEYRLVMKNTLEFDPEILKRYVNFMNNPDERTAVDQFGKGDKYFGVCTMMATMPGLPMFGHGQIEGYAEKYGMEFRRAYWEEQPDPTLVERHEREIFPLLRRRYQFAEVENFLLYDFFTPEGTVNEDVYAFSNRTGNDRSLVLYHNRYSSTHGWVRTSAAYSVKQGDERVLVQKSLGEGLALKDEADTFVIFRENTSGLEFIRSNQDIFENGLYAELEAYKYLVFLDFREVEDDQWHPYRQLAGYLNGRGVPSIDEALQEIFLQPVHNPFRELANPGFFRWLIDNRWLPGGAQGPVSPPNLPAALDETRQKMQVFLQEVKNFTGAEGYPAPIAEEVRLEVEAALSLPILGTRFPMPNSRKYHQALRFLENAPGRQAGALEAGNTAVWSTLFTWLFIRRLARLLAPENQEGLDFVEQSRTWIDEWLLGKIIVSALKDLGSSEEEAWRQVTLVKILTSHQAWCDLSIPKRERPYQALHALLKDAEVQYFIVVNRYQGALWFNQESFEELLWWMFTGAVIDIVAAALQEGEAQSDPREIVEAIEACYQVIQALRKAEESSAFQVEKLLEAVQHV